MKYANVVHNPHAGDQAHTKEKLLAQLEECGFKCRYSSTKKSGWRDIPEKTDVVVVAGGDGTVKKMVTLLLNRKPLRKSWPIAIWPAGTANNFSKTLGIGEPEKENISNWYLGDKIKRIDVGAVYGLKEANFFMEGLGYGAFPYLMNEMLKRGEIKGETPEEELSAALKILHRIILSYEPRQCTLSIDGKDHSGRFLLAEVMNIRSIGPNLFLARDADPGDGFLDVVILREEDKDRFASYVADKIQGKEEDYAFESIRGKKIEIQWDGRHVHVDDKVFKTKKGKALQIEVKAGVLEFFGN
jgi:diacylglycerol kinase (ATP)